MTETPSLETALESLPEADRARVVAARDWAAELHEGKVRASGEAAVTHPERVAAILVSMGLDTDTVIAGLLHHAFEDGATTPAMIAGRFGPVAAGMVDEVTKIAALKAKNKTMQAAETIRKMLFAMAKDIRVILIKLADKLDNMRTLRWLPESERKRIAAECVDVFAPLADRLGISWLKDELEDLALKEINREAFDQIKSIVSGRREEREEILARVEEDIKAEAALEGIAVTVSSRAKHFYSIYLKMRKRAKGSDELFDLLGIRVFCETESDCYTILGSVHKLWKPMEGRFKDYIAMPKSNGYRSLHTTVMGYGGRLLEIQIRTHEMHSVAEHGVASHWLYKKGHSGAKPAELPIMARVRDWNEMAESGSDFLADIKRELLKDSIFVFTPKGDAIELPSGSTPLDFAYGIHTDIGNRTISAKADGAIMPLNGELRNTQVVEIQTSATARPNINWLRSVKTSKARSKIRAWLLANGQALVIDRNVVAKHKAEHRLEHEPRPDPKHDEKPDEKRAAPGEQEKGTLEIYPYKPNEATDSLHAGISVTGSTNLMIRFAGCCRPSTGDAIVGYVSRGRGIIVHKASCTNLPSIAEFRERRVDVQWETAPTLLRRYRVRAKRSFALFSEIDNAVKKYSGRLVEGKLEDGGDSVTGYFTMAFEDVVDARKVERGIRGIPSILFIERIG